MNSSADLGISGQLPCSGSNAGASYSQAGFSTLKDGPVCRGGAVGAAATPHLSHGGLESISGVARTDALHNFTYQRADWPRLIPVGINGVVNDFLYFPFIHE